MMVEGFLQWFNRQKQHEQLMIFICALLVLVYLLYSLAWKPLAQQQSRLQTLNTEARDTLQKIRALAAEYEQLTASGRSGEAAVGNLSGIVDQTVASHGLSMKRYQPSASGDAQVRFENQRFDNILGWLYEMEFTHSVIIRDLSITKANAEGLVNLSVRMGFAQ